MARIANLLPTSRSRKVAAVASILALSAALLTAVPAAANAEVVGTGPGSISGTASTTDGQPVEGIYVYASVSSGEATSFSAYTRTDATGHYEFSGLAFATYAVQASLSGYQPAP